MSDRVTVCDYNKIFSEQQMKAAHDAISMYRDGRTNWVILLAQMQSGKTETFLFIACELIRFGRVQSIVIFSGCAEKELEKQLNDTITGVMPSFWRKYRRHIGQDNCEDLEDTIKRNKLIQVVWGNKKSSYCGPTENTLFIWEEAHFAQNKDQGPNEFLKKLNISADGDQNILQNKNNFVLTVSATPFSELSDLHHMAQDKLIVKMMPGQGYIGVKDIRDADRIRPWTDLRSGLNDALSLERNGEKWAIIRVTDNSVMVKEILASKGWKYVEYDSSISLEERNKGTCREPGYLAWQSMLAGEAPIERTAIIIKGMCRMGKNINKKHLLFVFETSKNPASDTVLQGLLGRVCGYGYNEVIVYLSAKFINRKDDDNLNDIDRYIQLWDNDGVQILPRKANNLCEKNVEITCPIIPIAIRRDRNISTSNDQSCVKDDVLDAFTKHPERIINKNTRAVFEEVKEKYIRLHKSNRAGLGANYFHSNKKTTRGPDGAKKIKDAFDNNEVTRMGSGGGIAANGEEINIWVNKDVNGFDKDIFYVTSIVTNVNRYHELIPKTHKRLREAFAHKLQDGTELTCNGGMPKLLTPETAYNWEAMCDQLTDFVEVSRDSAYYKGVISLGTSIEGEPTCICVTEQVLKELIEGGRIYKFVQSMGAKLKVEKARGPVPKSVKDANLVRLASIKWDFE
jgi:hypothetical protein